jgi:hypothetical protein
VHVAAQTVGFSNIACPLLQLQLCLLCCRGDSSAHLVDKQHCTDMLSLCAAGRLSQASFKAWKNALNWLMKRQHTLLVGQTLERSKSIHGDSTIQDESRNVLNTENKRLRATR